MAKHILKDNVHTRELVIEKLGQLEEALKHNIPKHAIAIMVRNIRLTLIENVDHTWKSY